MRTDGVLGSSFRDPSGFVFRHEGRLRRQVNECYAPSYTRLMESGLAEHLWDAGHLVRHREVETPVALEHPGWRTIEPDLVPFVSYPYEWCYSQLRDAALLTLSVQSIALEHGMTLKDASAYNVQFLDGRPLLIDTLSFEAYDGNQPWVAYRQFCQHFLAPLALMRHCHDRLGLLSRTFIDGVPLEVAGRLLPWWTKLRPGLCMHLHLQAKAQRRWADRPPDARRLEGGMGKRAMLGLIDSLTNTVKALKPPERGSEWSRYYEETNYSETAADQKREALDSMLEESRPRTVWDLGANTGLYSRVASRMGAMTVAFDVDSQAVELNYRRMRAENEPNMLPLVLDLTNPSAAIGWHSRERDSLLQRGPADLCMALALVHHLAVSNNVPLPGVAGFLRAAGRRLIIEFVPKGDSQVRRLLSTREDVFPEYHEQGFEQAFLEAFRILRREPIRDSARVLYLMEAR